MNFKLALSALSLGLVALVGCSANTDEGTSADSDLVAPILNVNVVGAWKAKAGTAKSPAFFEGIVFNENGTFFADVNTGIMCVTAPCPTTARLEGTYVVRGRSVLLNAKDPSEQDSGFYDRYSVTRTDDSISLSRLGGEGISNDLSLQSSYCSEASDCGAQGLLHPMCAPGGWTCSAENTCGFSCGVVTTANEVWPADRTQLVAQTNGGGFTPPPPAGSTCAIGAAKYTLDIATKTLSWETCQFSDWQTPLHSVSGSRKLTATELKKVDRAMADVKITHEDICGADKPMLNISVTSASKGTVEYTDSFYACMGGERLYVDNIDGVFGAFRDLAGE
jgi:hypothetical protein